MKKILSMLLVLLLLVGCMPTHNTEAAINFKSDFSGELVLTAELETEYLEDSAAEIEEKITKIVEGIDKYKDGTFTTKTQSKTLDFKYTESFKDLEELSTILSRIFEDDIQVTLEETDTIFRTEKHIKGLDFNAKEFTDAIYDAIEKEETFGENSKEARTYQEGYSTPELYMNGEYMSPYDNLSDEDFKNINRDTLFIEIIDQDFVNLINVIEASEELDLDELATYYEDKYKERILSRDSKAKLVVDKDKKTNSLTLTMENVSFDHIEDLEYDIFNRMIEFDASDVVDSDSKNIQFDVEVFDMGHTSDFNDVVLEREVNIDLGKFKILLVDDAPFEENGVYDFYKDGSMLTFEEDAMFSLRLEEGNAFSLNNILQYVVFAIIIIIVIVALFFAVKNTKKKSKNNNQAPAQNTVQQEQAVQEQAPAQTAPTPTETPVAQAAPAVAPVVETSTVETVEETVVETPVVETTDKVESKKAKKEVDETVEVDKTRPMGGRRHRRRSK